MSVKTVNQLVADGDRLALEIKSIMEKGGEATEEERASVNVKSAELETISSKLDTFDDTKALKTSNAFHNLRARLMEPDRPPLGNDGVHTDGGGFNRHGEYKSAGELFITADPLKSWLDMVCPMGADGQRRIPDKLYQESPSIEVKDLYSTAIDITANRPMLGLPERRREIVELGWNPLVLRQLITTVPTSAEMIEIVRELSRTSNAAIVPEATATSGASGLKPESAQAWERIQVNVQSIAHWVPATTRILADASQLRGIIDSFLRMGIDQALEDLILNGGSGTTFVGVQNTTGILTQAFATDRLITTRTARTKLKVEGFVNPTAWSMHPNDWQEFDLHKDLEGRYYWGGPTSMGVPRLWGIPVVESMGQTEGHTMLGYWPDAVLFDRQQTAVTVGTVNDDFIRNMVRILAEMRAAFVVRRPKSFIDADIVTP